MTVHGLPLIDIWSKKQVLSGMEGDHVTFLSQLDPCLRKVDRCLFELLPFSAELETAPNRMRSLSIYVGGTDLARA